MPEFDPHKVAEVVESYLGKRLGRFLIQLTIIAGLLGVIGLGFVWFFRNFVAGLLWPFFSDVFGAGAQGITLDNIEAIIITLVASIVILVLIFLIFALVMARAFRRRVVPQSAIDNLAELRSDGIHILNDPPPSEDQLQDWRERWDSWREDVLDALKRDFTVAERLSFQRLGVFPPREFKIAVNPVHSHFLSMFAHQLTILENLIQRHQERR